MALNIPAGKAIETRLELSKSDFPQRAKKLMDQGFTGYIALTIDGYAGIEEGMLFFRKGSLVASTYHYDKFDMTIFGDFAAKQVLNASKAEFGVVGISELSMPQMELIVAFNEKISLTREISPKDLNKLLPAVYVSDYSQQVLSDVLKSSESKYGLFKKLGLQEI